MAVKTQKQHKMLVDGKLVGPVAGPLYVLSDGTSRYTNSPILCV